MDNKCNIKECKESCNRNEEREKEFEEALTEGMCQYEEALSYLKDK